MCSGAWVTCAQRLREGQTDGKRGGAATIGRDVGRAGHRGWRHQGVKLCKLVRCTKHPRSTAALVLCINVRYPLLPLVPSHPPGPPGRPGPGRWPCRCRGRRRSPGTRACRLQGRGQKEGRLTSDTSDISRYAGMEVRAGRNARAGCVVQPQTHSRIGRSPGQKVSTPWHQLTSAASNFGPGHQLQWATCITRSPQRAASPHVPYRPPAAAASTRSCNKHSCRPTPLPETPPVPTRASRISPSLEPHRNPSTCRAAPAEPSCPSPAHRQRRHRPGPPR